MADTEYIYAPVANYYGTPYVYESDGSFFFGLEDYADDSETEVSEAFFRAFVDEFKDHQEATAPPTAHYPAEKPTE